MPDGYTQLVMQRKTLDNLPDIIIPEGFSLRYFENGDETAWDEIVGDMCSEGFGRAIKAHCFFTPERVKMICYNGRPVATATAWGDEGGCKTLGMVHMVAADERFRGKGLGFAVTDAVLHQMKKEGKSAAYLTTDDFRIPAIRTYLRLGFEPDKTREGHNERWETICGKIL
jgi:mycothiol synthase